MAPSTPESRLARIKAEEYWLDNRATYNGQKKGEPDEYGNTYWRNAAGRRHRDGDLPAVEWANGNKYFYRNGQLHRDGDLPAVEYADGYKAFWRNGQYHRDGDLPAVEYANGDKAFYRNGVEYTPAPPVPPCQGKLVEIDGVKYKLVSA